jgi:hypothetical protein
VTTQPGHRPAATPAGPHTPDTLHRAAQIAAAVDAVYEQPTTIRINDPDIPSWHDGPRIGTTPAITNQPGSRRPAMSQRAVDLNTTILSSSVLVASLGGATCAVLWASSVANSTVIQWICGCAVAVPTALAVAALAFKSFMKSAKEVVAAAPPQINQYYSGHVDQRTTQLHSSTRGVIAVTKNTPELPR